MANDADQRIRALRRSHDELTAFVDGLDEAGLATQSGSSEWTIAQVLSHLGSGAEIGRNTLLAAVEGRPPPDRETVPAIWERWNAMSPAEMADGSHAAGEQLVADFERLGEDTLENLRVDLGFLPEPIDVATTVTFRLNEQALHSWDVHVGFDSDAVVAADAVPFLSEQMVRMSGFVAKPIGKQATVGIETTEPEGQWVLELGDDVALSPGGDGAAEPGTTLRLPAEAMVRLASGRLKPPNTPPSVSIEGDLSLDDLRGVFPGF